MKIEYLGHSSFYFEGNGVRILTDPYDTTVGYRQANRHADFTLVSHDHWDHNYVDGVAGRTHVITGSGIKQLSETMTVRGVMADHDSVRGGKFGLVNMFAWTMDGVRIVFLSDLGHVLRQDQLADLGPADLLLIPVGGHYTIDGPTARAVVRQFSDVRIVVPMHYRTPSLNLEKFPITGPEPFLEGYERVRQERSGTMTLDKKALPADVEVVVLTPMF